MSEATSRATQGENLTAHRPAIDPACAASPPLPLEPRSDPSSPPPSAPVLIASTTRWPIAARLAGVIVDLGLPVAVVCPTSDPALALRDPIRRLRYSPSAPRQALARAIDATGCSLIIPCDDRVVVHLHTLHAEQPALRPMIERSIGPPKSFPIVDSRAALARLATAAGLRVPESYEVAGPAALAAIAEQCPFPWVMKLDGTWGGAGVWRANDMAAALVGMRRLGRVGRFSRALCQWIIRRNFYPLWEIAGATQARISVQRYIDGDPANLLATAWQGEIVAELSFNVLRTQRPFGASTLAQVINQPEMHNAAHTLARLLGLCGYFGLDFVIERVTGHAYLIEINPRTTQFGHLRLGAGGDLPGALLGRAFGLPFPATDCTGGNPILAMFPDAQNFGVEPALLAAAFLDMPLSRPELVRELMRRPYSNRGLVARIYDGLNGWARRKKSTTGL